MKRTFKMTVAASLGFFLFASFSRAAVRIIPRKDKYARCDQNNPTGISVLDRAWCQVGIRVMDNLSVTKSLFDLDQLNTVLGGNKDLVYQVRQGQFEVFMCPSMRDIATPLNGGAWGGRMAVSAAAQDQSYWQCKQIYSAPVDSAQICSDYISQARARVVLDKAFNQIVGTLTIGQIPFLSYGIGLVLSTTADVLDMGKTVKNYIQASCQNQNFDAMLDQALNSGSGLTYVGEPFKFAVLESIAVHGTRTDAGRQLDNQVGCSAGNAQYRSSSPADLAYGDRSRRVSLNPNQLQNGAMNYQAAAMDPSINPMSMGNNEMPGQCPGSPNFNIGNGN